MYKGLGCLLLVCLGGTELFIRLRNAARKLQENFLFMGRIGATDGVRTRDLRLGKPPLCQLSYYRNEYTTITAMLRVYCVESDFFPFFCGNLYFFVGHVGCGDVFYLHFFFVVGYFLAVVDGFGDVDDMVAHFFVLCV